MFVRVERGSAVPISRQISAQIRAQCLSGTLKPGSRLPSVRQLARELAVNQNTILHVYERLVVENLLEMRHGEGTFVASVVPLDLMEAQRASYSDELTRLVRQGRMLGLSRKDIRNLIDEAFKSPETQPISDGARQ
jgi:GntR family transcriptional regulator